MVKKIGFWLGWLSFLLVLFLPSTKRMYVEGFKVVLKHSDKTITEQFPQGITTENFDQMYQKAKSIHIKIPKDFAKTGIKGITSTENGKMTLDKAVNIQTRALKYTLALAILMAILWITEAMPIPIVAMFPLVLLPLLGIAHYKYTAFPGYFNAFAPYMHYLVVLFIGGFTIAEAMKRWGLHERIALHIVKIIGFSAEKLIFGLMIATAIVSMFVSNTATTAMMMPIALAILLGVGETPGESNFGKAMMLGIAYAASIGGIGTLIGTPPNLVFAAFADSLLDKKITFANWLMIGLPVVIVLLPITWWMLIRYFKVKGKSISSSREVIEKRIAKLGKMGVGERNTLIIFVLVALMWITRTLWTKPLHLYWVNDSVIAIIGVLLFYIVPVNFKEWKFTLDWETNKNIPWGTLLLFGGGIALGTALQKTGAAAFISMYLTDIGKLPLPLIILGVVLLVDFLTEITSNTATTNMMMPILFALAMAIHQSPTLLMVAGAVAASLAFMMPVATPPNAIVYGTGYVKMKDMVKFGFLLDIVAGITYAILLSFLLVRVLP